MEDRATEKIGTTGRGIGPAYEEKVGRRGIRVADLAGGARLEKRAREGLQQAVGRLGGSTHDLEEQLRRSLECGPRLTDLATDTGREITAALSNGKRVLLEGAQGTALDLDHGTYPFVTSSNTTAGGAGTGVGIGPTAIDQVVGVVKAYTTRVGNGPLPTGFDSEMDLRVRELGGEYGATTGRPRRCGWFDAVLARYSARVNGLTGLAVTKLDVLDTLPEVSIAVEYSVEGQSTRDFPADTWSLETATPRYETHPGWKVDTSGAKRLADLPRNARAYLDRVEELTGAPITMISVGTRRSQIIRV